jgi:DNA-binding Xre family transcriptional regulator/phage-related protein
VNKKWSVLFCGPHFNPCPVTEFLEACKPAHQIKVMHFLELLEESGPTLPRPYADILQEGIHELRIKLSGEQVRLLYFFCFETFIVLYLALKKHGSAVPEHAILETVRYRRALMDQVDRNELESHAKFGAYLHGKCSDPGFKEQYERRCTVCGKTAAIVSRMRERGISAEEMSNRTGVSVKNLTKLEAADWCRFDEVRTLCRALDIEEPGGCVKQKYEADG